MILSGHLDVVPPGDPATWTADPWGAEVRDGRMYGRGACDMKGGIASILGAVRALALERRPGSPRGELMVVFVPSEEDGGQGTLAAIRAGATGDLAIITEPSNLDVVVAHAGAITFRLTVPGRAAHASQRREGVSALDKLFALARALEADEDAPQRRRDGPADDGTRPAVSRRSSASLGAGSGRRPCSTGSPRTAATAFGWGSRRQTRRPSCGRRSRTACAADDFLREHPATVEITGGRFGSARVPSDHPLPVGLADVVEAVTGRRPALLGEPYGADMQMFVNVGDTPCVIFGPGDVRVAHSADEFVPLDEVETCARVLAAWVLRELGTA